MPKFATKQGTQSFRENAENNGISSTHFSVFDGLHLSGIGMGTYLGNKDEPTNKAVIDAALTSLRSGAINILDSAINYRGQLAERSIGRAISALPQYGITRDQIFLSSKIGYIPGDADLGYHSSDYVEKVILEQGVVPRKEIVDDVHCMHPKYLEHQLNQSLTNLRIDGIDLIYLHNPGEAQLPKIGRKMFRDRLYDAFEYLELARDEGKIKYYGLATWDSFRVSTEHPAYINLENLVYMAQEIGGQEHGFRFIQLPINLILPEAMTDNSQTFREEQVILLKAARELGIGVFSSVPLMQSKLLQYRLPDINNYTPSQVCLEFVRSIPEILAPLVGHKKHEHVRSNTELGKMDCLKVDEYRKTFFEK